MFQRSFPQKSDRFGKESIDLKATDRTTRELSDVNTSNPI